VSDDDPGTLDKIFRHFNPLICWILRSPLHWILSPGLLLLTFTGRRSGRQYTIPVGYQRFDDTVVILASRKFVKTWWRNYQEPGAVALRIKGRDMPGTAEVVPPESPEFGERFDASFQRMPWLGKQFGIRYDKKTGLTADQIAVVRGQGAAVRVSLETP
jgi:deazaflavin-dependent oxidoreductase (nitroreductase family)